MLVTPPTIGNLFRTFGSRFVEPVDDLGVTSPLIDETTKGNTTNSGFGDIKGESTDKDDKDWFDIH
jgi:hypothetical protein